MWINRINEQRGGKAIVFKHFDAVHEPCVWGGGFIIPHRVVFAVLATPRWCDFQKFSFYSLKSKVTVQGLRYACFFSKFSYTLLLTFHISYFFIYFLNLYVKPLLPCRWRKEVLFHVPKICLLFIFFQWWKNHRIAKCNMTIENFLFS